MFEGERVGCSRCGYRDRSPNGSFRLLQALTLHRGEQYTAVDRRPTPTIHRTPQTGHSASPAPLSAAAVRFRNCRSVRHCLARHAAQQYTA